jgi:hypothetical protein
MDQTLVATPAGDTTCATHTATEGDGMTFSYREALVTGNKRNAEAMAEAHKRVVRNGKCNGAEDCPAEHHLVCCLKKKPIRERIRFE